MTRLAAICWFFAGTANLVASLIDGFDLYMFLLAVLNIGLGCAFGHIHLLEKRA